MIRLHGYVGLHGFLTLQEIGELSGVVEDCDALEEFDYRLYCWIRAFTKKIEGDPAPWLRWIPWISYITGNW